jgi:phage baseplate assembly protein W
MSDTASILTGPLPTFSKTIRGYRAVPTLFGDTLERIAMRELGDAAQWYDLAQLNRLVPPYIVTDPGLVGPGLIFGGRDTILVPSTAPAATGVAQAPSVFGTDCLLVGGQLQPNGAGDYAVVSEGANLQQALMMRLGTHPGDLVYHPKYGCRAYTLLGRGGTPMADQLAAAFVAAAIQADPRIAQARNTVASTVGDVLSASSLAVAVNGKRLPVGVGTGIP